MGDLSATISNWDVNILDAAILPSSLPTDMKLCLLCNTFMKRVVESETWSG